MQLRGKLLLGFGILAALLVAGSLLIHGHMVGMQDVAAAARDHAETDRLVTELGALSGELYAHSLHYVLTREDEHIQHVKHAAEQLRQTFHDLQGKITAPEHEAVLSRISGFIIEMERTFFDEIVAAVHAGRTGDFRGLHDRIEGALDGIRASGVHLHSFLKSEGDAALKAAKEHSDGTLMGMGICCGLGFIASVVFFFYFHRAIVDPIRRLMRATEDVASGNLTADTPVRGNDEIATLGRQFNWMTDRIRQNQEQMIRAERTAALGTIAAGIAHQLNNPIAVILGYVKSAKDDRYRQSVDLARAFSVIEEEASECQSVVKNLLELAHPVEIPHDPILVRELVDESINHAKRYAGSEDLRITEQVEPSDLSVRTDKSKIRQALINLIVNGIEAIGGKGELKIDAQSGGSDGRTVIISVSDSGPGIAPEDVKRLFTPFYSSKPRGRGLGLAIAHALVTALEGDIEVRSEKGKGSTFSITLPLEE